MQSPLIHNPEHLLSVKDWTAVPVVEHPVLAFYGEARCANKQVSSRGRSWIMATMLADGVHWGGYWQLKLYVSKADLLICSCPLATALFEPSPPVNGLPILPGVQVKGLGVSLCRALWHTAHLQIPSKCCWSSLPNICRLRPFLTAFTTTALAKAAPHCKKKLPS